MKLQCPLSGADLHFFSP